MRNQGRPVVVHGDWVLCPCKRNRVIAMATNMNYGHRNENDGQRGAKQVGYAGRMVKAWTPDASSDVQAESDEEIIEQGFALLENGTTPVDGYRYDLYFEGVLHTSKGTYSSDGKTVGVQGQKTLRLVTWMARDSASKDL
ncbi:hypothetical protein GCM10011408_15310 [Dyella caseinilytica]|nr:hypothetical protein GCM10011408_15310 [Dyella caseinilytica]